MTIGMLAARVANLKPVQRRALQALCAGAQLLRRFGKYEIYQERDGKVLPAGIALTNEQVDALSEAVQDRLQLVRNPGPTQCDGFFWLPAAARNDCLDALTMTMPTGQLNVQQRGEAAKHTAMPRERVA